MKKNLLKKSGGARNKISVSSARLKIKKFLVATDFSAESLAGVHFSVALADKLGAAVTLVHVVEPASRMAGMEAVVLAYDDSELTALARAELDRIGEREKSSDLNLTTCLRVGNPFHEITICAREHSSDLVVIATHGYTGAKRVLLGSTAERVVRHAPCPVLTIPARTIPKRIGKTPSFKIEKILVPIDFSNLGRAALPWGTSLAAQLGAELILLHVVPEFPIDYLLGRELMSQTITPLVKQAEADLESMAGNLCRSTGVKISTMVRSGTPFEEISQTARALRAGMIVLTTHGYTGLKHVWLGSTAERVVRHATCPVLVVRERADNVVPEAPTDRIARTA